MNPDRLLSVVARELDTVVRTRTFTALAVAFAAVVLGIAWAGGTPSYLSTVLTLLTPVEALVPALAVAFGYRAVRADAARGELAVIRTYPVTRLEYTLGLYVGRAAALLVAVLVPLLLVVPVVARYGGAGTDVVAAHGGTDSVLLYLRFLVLVAAFTLVALAIAVAISTLARGGRSALALGVGAVLLLVVGLDLAVVAGVGAGVFGGAELQYVLALSPNSAFRALVLETVVGTAADTGRGADALAGLLGLAGWFVAGTWLAVVTTWPGER